MATIESILAIIGQAADSDAVRSLVMEDNLAEFADSDLEEGEPQRFYLSNFEAGYELTYCSNRVTSGFVYVVPADGFQSFSGTLPGGLTSQASRLDVREKFGVPSRSGEAKIIPVLGRQGAWDRFNAGPVCLHFQYTEPDERLRLVTVMATEVAP